MTLREMKELRQIVPNKRDKDDKKKEEELKRDKERYKEIIMIQLYCITYATETDKQKHNIIMYF